MALTKLGEIYVWGDNASGQLGLGHCKSKHTPRKLKFKFEFEFKFRIRFKSIKCGGRHSMALDELGKMYVWGSNDYGQLGLGHTNNMSEPQALYLTEPIAQIESNSNHTIALTHNDSVYVWGWNSDGQLGLGHTIDQWLPQKLVLTF